MTNTDCPPDFENCICIPVGGDECQVLQWHTSPAGALWDGRLDAVTNLTYFNDDCATTYTCGDVCLSWSPVIGAAGYRVIEGDTILIENTTLTNFTIPLVGNDTRTFTVIPLSCINLLGLGADIMVTFRDCSLPCSNLIFNGSSADEWQSGSGGLGLLNIGVGANPGANVTTQAVNLTTMNYEMVIEFDYACLPAFSGLHHFRLVTQIDGVTVYISQCFTPYSATTIDFFSFTSTASVGVHTFATYLQRCGSSPLSEIQMLYFEHNICNF